MLQHRYQNFECNQADEKASQPDDIKIQLKPHQLTSIAKMAAMEAGRIAYDTPNGLYEVDAVSIGILADKAGYGKTMTTLGLLASNQEIDVQTSVVQSSFEWSIGQAFCIRKNSNYLETHVDLFLNTTLIVVKRGIVFQQWSKAISQNTTLTCIEISTERHLSIRNRELLQASIRGKNIVLVSDSVYRNFMYASELRHWKRVVVDEADDIFCPSMPDVSAKFIWFVTATPERLIKLRNKGFIRNACPQMLFYESRLLYKFIMVRNEDSYILGSFNVPSCTTTCYLCREAYQGLCEFATPHLQELLNANDLQGALQSLNGTDGDDINRLIVRKTGTEIENLKIMIEAVERQIMPERDKQAKLISIDRNNLRCQGRERRKYASAFERAGGPKMSNLPRLDYKTRSRSRVFISFVANV